MMTTKLRFFLLSFLICSPVYAEETNLQEQISEARDELIQEGQENRHLKAKVDDRESTISELREELERLEQETAKEGES